MMMRVRVHACVRVRAMINDDMYDDDDACACMCVCDQWCRKLTHGRMVGETPAARRGTRHDG
jgi:hypothetical protein